MDRKCARRDGVAFGRALLTLSCVAAQLATGCGTREPVSPDPPRSQTGKPDAENNTTGDSRRMKPSRTRVINLGWRSVGELKVRVSVSQTPRGLALSVLTSRLNRTPYRPLLTRDIAVSVLDKQGNELKTIEQPVDAAVLESGSLGLTGELRYLFASERHHGMRDLGSVVVTYGKDAITLEFPQLHSAAGGPKGFPE